MLPDSDAMRIYLNNSALNRPYDDRGLLRVRIEADAVVALLEAIEKGSATLVSSEFVEVEALQAPDQDRTRKIRRFLALAERSVKLSDAVAARAAALAPAGLRGFDALHVASAEAGAADLLVTTDDRMLRRAARVRPPLRVRVVTPMDAAIALDQEKA